jgi:hypothetical protein
LHLTCNWKQDETMDATKTKPFNIDKKLVYDALMNPLIFR